MNISLVRRQSFAFAFALIIQPIITTFVFASSPHVNSQYYECNLEPVIECNYRHPLSDAGYDPLGTGSLTTIEAETLLTNAYRQLFTPGNHGDAQQDNSRPVLYNYGSDEAYILDVNNNDVRSEGISYGMMISVQMGDQVAFDKLWRFAKNRMRQPNGQFGWQWSPSEERLLSTGAAPDGEVYMAMALFFAHHRWGNNTNMNYQAEANTLLDMMRTTYFHSTNYQIRFIVGADYTDPSYHVPAFYELWGLWAASQTNRDFYQNAAAASRAYLKVASHPSSGLFTDYMNFDGTPVPYNTNNNPNASRFAHDSWRTIQNMAVDYRWWSFDSELKDRIERMQNFFRSKGLTSYKDVYEHNGGEVSGAGAQSPGIIWMNATSTLVDQPSTGYNGADFLGRFVDDAPQTGRYRYYNGLLQMFGLLHVSGHYRIWGPYGTGARSTDMNINTWSPALRLVAVNNSTGGTLQNFTARYYFTAESNKMPRIIRSATNKANLSLKYYGNNIWAVNMNFVNYSLANGQTSTKELFELGYTDGTTISKSADYSNEKIKVSKRFAVYNSSGSLVQGGQPSVLINTDFSGQKSLRNAGTGKVLTATGGNNNDPIRLRSNNNLNSQDWIIEKIPGSYFFRFKNKWTNEYMKAKTNAEGAIVVNYTLDPAAKSEQWLVEPVAGTNSVRVRNAWSGKYLSAVDNTDNSAAVILNLYPDATGQMWNFF